MWYWYCWIEQNDKAELAMSFYNSHTSLCQIWMPFCLMTLVEMAVYQCADMSFHFYNSFLKPLQKVHQMLSVYHEKLKPVQIDIPPICINATVSRHIIVQTDCCLILSCVLKFIEDH